MKGTPWTPLDWLNTLGAISSLLGLAFTLFVFKGVRAIKASFLRQERLPELLEDLDQSSLPLLDEIKKWKSDQRPARKRLAEIYALLENIELKLHRTERKRIAPILDLLRSVKTEQAAWDCYQELSAAMVALRQMHKDEKWG
jgi:hypothetical protein